MNYVQERLEEEVPRVECYGIIRREAKFIFTATVVIKRPKIETGRLFLFLTFFDRPMKMGVCTLGQNREAQAFEEAIWKINVTRDTQPSYLAWHMKKFKRASKEAVFGSGDWKAELEKFKYRVWRVR